MSKANQKPTLSKDQLYDVILSPVITEKATQGSQHNQVTFRVRSTHRSR